MNEKVTKQKKVFHQMSAQQLRSSTTDGGTELAVTGDRYKLLVDELQQVAPVYVGEMKRVHQKAQNIEKRKIQFLEDILSAFVSITDLTKYQNQLNSMGKLGLDSINMIHTSNDLDEWNTSVLFDEPLAVAGFEPYEVSQPPTTPNPTATNNENGNNNIAMRQSMNGSVKRFDVFVNRENKISFLA